MKKIPIEVKLTVGTIADIDKSVKTGKFMNRSDFIRDSIRKADETEKETLEKGLSNLDEHENLSPRLLKIEKKIEDLGLGSSINFILLMIILLYLLFFGGVLL